MLSAVALPVSAQPDKVITPPQLKQVMLIHYEAGSVSAPALIAGKNYTNYKLIGPSWDLSEYPSGVAYVIDPDYGPKGAAVEVAEAFEAWDNATSADLYNDSYTVDRYANPSTRTPDFKNVVCWRLIAGYPNAIALTSIWYYDIDKSGGPSVGDEMADCDIIFNLRFKWGIDPDGEGTNYLLPKGYFDVCNIATHEAGHVTGLDDLYDKVDSEMTMYGYGAARETKKISLEIGDKNGCVVLYGGELIP